MSYSRFSVCLANLDPHFETEAGKTRPVVVVQTDLLNVVHPSTLICPITTNVQPRASLLRVHLATGEGGVYQDCDIMVDQLRTIDNRRFIRQIGTVPPDKADLLVENLRLMLDIT
jgi:mRNA interferase MazF